MAHEINLVPEIKDEMIRALKLRNLIFFLCIIVSAAAIGAVIVFGSIAGGQNIALSSKKDTLALMSSTVNSYEDLNDFLTIQDQTKKLDTISDNKTLVSRIFNFISILKPTNGDEIKISEITANMTDSSFLIEAQANALNAPYIDYNVLDAFKKSMSYLTYDYGVYVDREGNDIPAYCIIDTDESGTFFNDNNNIYAYWMVDMDGCKPEYNDKSDSDESNENDEEEDDSNNEENDGNEGVVENYETYNNERVVKIWRTPQFNDWYNDEFITLDGEISGIEHFESSCREYYGEENSAGNIIWKVQNSDCLLINDSESGIKILESSNGRDSTGTLVLRFTASITFEPEAFKFKNTHAMFFGPDGKYNVTDSYLQLQKMFSERAVDCDKNDPTCSMTSTGGY